MFVSQFGGRRGLQCGESETLDGVCKKFWLRYGFVVAQVGVCVCVFIRVCIPACVSLQRL